MFIKELTSSAGQRHPNACVPPTKGKGGNVRGWCWGAGTDYRAPLEPTLGLPGERALGGRTEKPASLAAWPRISLQTGAFFPGVPAFTHVLFVCGKDC